MSAAHFEAMRSRDEKYYHQKPVADWTLQLHQTDRLPAHCAILEHLKGRDQYYAFLLGGQQQRRDKERSMTQYVQEWSDNWARISGFGEGRKRTDRQAQALQPASHATTPNGGRRWLGHA
ncbi:MAG: hypothetical protein FRX48_04322 [Lasallia pustulata]|uniref:Uncharacterized protein n=1 Tax=Lasallia pustulata TaxID=136370 RepID=A0A5M8PRM1_9LECA|nr:MAG: hypothetical protein FRX48_04322 [Lasallia pustulata]